MSSKASATSKRIIYLQFFTLKEVNGNGNQTLRGWIKLHNAHLRIAAPAFVSPGTRDLLP
jgi:hypothetical protein